VPSEYRQKYIDVLHKHQKAISVNKYDLRLATNFKHKIHLKDNNLVYKKQCKIPEAHFNFIEQSLEEWLKLGIVKHYTTHQFFVFRKNKAMVSEWFKTSEN
jgi:hypothetical protein